MRNEILKPKRALISVSDKSGIVDFCRFLHQSGVELVSTGGTAKTLSENQLPYTPIEKITGNPEAFGGRMKTISFQVGSALLFRRDHADDQEQAKRLGIQPIDLVVCNLYPFEKTARENKPLPDLIENIDIGGPTMVRAAAKNYDSVACVLNPGDYPALMNEMKETGGISFQTRQQLSLKTWTAIASYDLAIAVELSKQFGESLRYGENPHQSATLLPVSNVDVAETLANAQFIQGKELSYNNLLDSDQAYKCCSELTHAGGKSVCVIVKHGIPCGVAQHAEQLTALQLAWDADSTSAFGGILCFNQEISVSTAQWLKDKFIEVIIAPKYSEEALSVFATKKNLRVLKCALKPASAKEWTVRSINGGLLCQDEDQGISKELVSKTKIAYPETYQALSHFGLVVTKYLKSNCIGIYAEKQGGFVVLASGVGQPNRLDCITRLAATRLKEKKEDVSKAILVSDAFFPFRDSIEAAQVLGVKYILQPGGSVRDGEVIQACDEFGIAMAFTGKRHFRH